MRKTRSINLLALLLTALVLAACGISTSGDASAGATPEPSVAPVQEPTSGSAAEPAAVPTGGISELQAEAEMLNLTGTSWHLVDLNLDQEPGPDGNEVTLRFDEGQISGSAGCNDYTAGVTAGEDGLLQSITAGPIAASKMLCEDPEATLENTYLARLGKVVAWRYAFGFLSLTYELEDSVLGELLFAPAGS